LIGAPGVDVVSRNVWSDPAAWSEASSDFAATLLKNREPSETWRSSNNFGANTGFNLFLDTLYPIGSSTSGATVTGVGICNHNIAGSGGYYRIIGQTGTVGLASDPREILVPTGFVSSSNMDGSYTNIDETWSSPDGAGLSLTSTASTGYYQMSFNTPSANPSTGAAKQQFWVYYYATDVLRGQTIQAGLYESGSLVADLGKKFIRGGGSPHHWVVFPWNASSLATATGANVELRLTINPVNGYGFLIDTVAWVCEVDSDITGAASTAWDSGWTQYTLPTTGAWYEAAPEDLYVPHSIYYGQSNATWISALTVLFAVDNHPVDISTSNNFIPNPADYVEVGSVIAGKKWSPGINRSYGQLLKTVPLTQVQQTQGGQTFGSNLPVLRELPIPLDWLTADEGAALIDRLAIRMGQLRPVFVAILPDDSDLNQLTAFPAVVSGGVDLNYGFSSNYPLGLQITLREKR